MATVLPETRAEAALGTLSWGSIIGGAFGATALSSVLLAFGIAVGLATSSTSPTWRDTSAALALLSGIYLVLQSLVAFGFGGYIAGRTRATTAAPADTVERSDGGHGLLSWALAILIGAFLAAAITAAGTSGKTQLTAANASSAEPLLSYELDRLFRAPRRSPNVDLSSERAEAGRILMTSAGHTGMTADDRTFLVQQVAGVTGLAAPEAERRVDDVISKARAAIRKSRQIAVILAFATAAALLLGAVAAWSAAVAGGRHRDGEALPLWMTHGDFLTKRRTTFSGSAPPPTPRPLPE